MTEPDQGDAATLRRHLDALLDITRRLASEPRLDPLLESIAEETCNLLDAERATLFLYDPSTNELYSRIATKSEIEVIRMPADRGIAGSVARTQACLVIPDAYSDPRFNREVDRKTGWRTRNILAVPMTNLNGHLVGVVEALNKRSGPFTDGDAALMRALADQAGVALERARLLEQFLAKRRLEDEMQLAQQIQADLLPEQPPPSKGFDLGGWNRPSEYAGGDFYDLFAWGDGRIGMMLGDAVGHGVGPALLAATTRALIRALALRDTCPACVLADTNRLLAADVEAGRFVTLALVVLDDGEGTATYASAGHGPLLLTRADGTDERFSATGLPLGILPDAEFDASDPMPLASGDAFFLISDGIFECETADGKELGFDAVVEQIREHLSGSAGAVIGAIEGLTDSVRPGGHFRDDRTVVVAKRL
ncbi:MAG: GAF domain-containing SpoIIE family protein phosphatase [Phycisphaerae bacterium]